MDESILTFTEALASAAPAPGGGGAAALMGALAASLGAMASRLSAGRKGDAERSARLNGDAESCEALRLRFLEQIAADEAAFLPLAAAYKLPKDEPERAETLRAASLGACGAALEMLRLCGKTAALLAALRRDANPLLLSDVGCAAAACRAALLCAALNVYVNTKPYPADPEAVGLNALTESMLREHLPVLEDLELQILMDLRNEET